MRAPVIYFTIMSAVAVFGYFALTDMAKRSGQDRELVTESETETADAALSTQELGGQAAIASIVMTIEGQPVSWDAQSLTLSEQLERQSVWLRSEAGEAAIDEDLVTENHLYGHDTPYPSQHNVALDERGLLLVERVGKKGSVIRRWNPHTGEMKAVLLLQGVVVSKGIVSESGLVFLVRETSGGDLTTDNLVFVNSNGGGAMVPLGEVREKPHLTLLPDNSVLIIGGKDAVTGQRLSTVERFRAGPDKLEVERLPDVPGPSRWGYALVVLQDGRLMVVGGNTAKYKGCKAPECSDKTYILDPEIGQWTEGPVLNEPRASATASLLADGSVIVAGGWTADRVGNARPSRGTERLRAGGSEFTLDARLPIAVAEHRALTAAGNASSPVLLIDGEGKSVITYDLELGEWRAAGGFSTFTKFQLGPFYGDHENFFWVSDGGGEEWARQTIRLRGHKPDTTLPETATVHLYRAATGYLADQSGLPAMIIGGHSSNPFKLTAAVDSFSEEQGLQALSSLTSTRYDAQVFRMGSGAIAVAGGVGEHSATRYPNTMAPPIELLRKVSPSEKWQTLGIAHPVGTQYAQLGDDVLIALLPGRAVDRLTIDSTDSEAPRVTRKSLPPLPVHRESGTQTEERVVARGLKDGRLVVAGGYTYDKRIAIYQEVMDTADEYVGIGSLVPANTYEVFDPASGQWTTSAPASERGGQVVLLEDETVVKLHIKPVGLEDDDGERIFSFLFEVSQAGRGEWSPLKMRQPPYVEASNTQLLSVGNELFVSGFSEVTIGRERKRVLWWLDGDQQEWKSVWEEPESSLHSRHQDVIAKVKISNGRELLVPVGGN